MPRNACYVIGWQLSWFGLVWAASAGWSLPASLLSLGLLIAVLLLWRDELARHAMLLAEAAWIAACFDGALALSGLVTYAPAGTALVPPWIVLLWMWLAGGVAKPMAFLQRRLWLAVPMGLVGGPAAYYAGFRWGALEMANPWSACLALAFGYGILLPWLAWRARRPGLPGLRCWERNGPGEAGHVV